jgi:CheY-like chemotaxis protein
MGAQAEAIATESHSPPVTGIARRPRLLVVEDDLDMRRLVSLMLEKDGYEVIQATNGVGLLAGMELSTWSDPGDYFDAIVSDIQMPDLTALDALAEVRDHRARVPVVLMTAYGGAQVRAKARALGVAAFLDKPIDWHELRVAVRRAITPSAG